MYRIFLVIFFSYFTYALELISPIPNEINYNKEKVELGKKLFNDKVLSVDNKASCSSCHLLLSGGDDNRKFTTAAFGHYGTLNTPTVYNAKYNFRQTWNGRYKDLKTHTLEALKSAHEKGKTLELVLSKVKKNTAYNKAFKSLYSNGVTLENLVDSIEGFLQILTTPDSPFDNFLKGDKGAISKKAQNGYKLFQTKGCVLCHNGINIGGNLYNKFGIYEDSNSRRSGRYELTNKEEDKFVFKVPSLRNIALTAPYMHDGRVDTLNGAVELMTEYQLGRYMEDGEIDDIVEFLKSLTGTIPEIVR